MASIVERPQKSGTSTYQVKWRQDGAWQSERFAERPGAEQFRKLVEAHGGQWPLGWVRGAGFIESEAQPGDVPLLDWAHRYVTRLTGVDARTRGDYERDVEQHLSVLQHTEPSGRVVQATICNLTADDVQDWVRAEEAGRRDPDDPKKWARRPASPKSLANRHGLLWCIVQAAVEADPPLRPRNCCKGTRLPRQDAGTDEEMVFLERDEYARIADEITDQHARDLADWLIGTGMRWGEATALQVRDLKLNTAQPTASVQRAWKRAPAGSDTSFYLVPYQATFALLTMVCRRRSLAWRFRQMM